jgi:magnesium chelatase subunit I
VVKQKKMKIENINTLGELKESGYKSNSIKELRSNLRAKIKAGEPAFEGVHGFENTVIPELNAPYYRVTISIY